MRKTVFLICLAALICSIRMLFSALLSAAILGSGLAAPVEAQQRPPQSEGILFVGSSIFQFWTHLNEQMVPLPVLNRAVAGSVTQDMLDRMDQWILPYKPRMVVFYCGSNDISAGESAEAILERTKRFLKILGEKAPDTFVYYTSILKAPEKMDRWNVVNAVNGEMERYSRQTRNLAYIDLNLVLFDRQGSLRQNLFLPDGLHFRPNSTAYPEFAQIVKPILTRAWESGVGLPKSNRSR